MVPPDPGQGSILAVRGDGLAARLLETLAPAAWPIPAADLPPGTALVGGAVRDALLGRLAARPDLDLVVAEDALALARRLARQRGGSVVVLDAERSIARLVLKGWTIDLARRCGAWPEEDLLRRDYSANAIALTLPCAGTPAALLDPAGGLADLAAGQLRAVAEANLLEDPLRLLRGVRLACELDLRIEPRTWTWIRTHHRALGAVAAERVLAELERLAAAPAGGAGLARVLEAELLAAWGLEGRCGADRGDGLASLAELLSGLDGARAAALGLSPVEATDALPLARLAVLLAPAQLQGLRASRRRQQRCGRLRQWWQRLQAVQGDPGGLAETERLRLQRDLEEEIAALVLLATPRWAQEALPRWRNADDRLYHPRPPLDGATLQAALGLKAGPQLGALLDHLCQERAFGRLPADPAADDPQTLTAARRWLSMNEGSRHG